MKKWRQETQGKHLSELVLTRNMLTAMRSWLDRMTLDAHGEADTSMSMRCSHKQWEYLRDMVVASAVLLDAGKRPRDADDMDEADYWKSAYNALLYYGSEASSSTTQSRKL